MPFTINATKESTRVRLVRHRRVDEMNGCWLWMGAVMPNGYGVINMRLDDNNCNRLVHRVSAWVFTGFDIFSEIQILHRCDVRRCFNPSHLFRGTQLDNIRDAWNKGHLNNEMQRHPKKLTPAGVIAIRSTYANGGCTTRSLAVELGLGKSTIEAIVNRRIWRHV